MEQQAEKLSSLKAKNHELQGQQKLFESEKAVKEQEANKEKDGLVDFTQRVTK